MESTRSDLLVVRLTPEETRMLTALAQLHGVTTSDVVRKFIQREHAQSLARRDPTRKP